MSTKKIGIIGVGNVGSTLAYSIATRGLCDTIVLRDIRENFVKAMALDVSQAANAAKQKVEVVAGLAPSDLNGCDIIVITAGKPRTPGMSRDDLLVTNANIIKAVVKDIKIHAPESIIITVSNPLDAMVYVALRESGFSKNKVMGMAGILDSARMSHFIFEKLGYGHGEIHASVMGGHGDDMVPLVNHSSVGNVLLTHLLEKEDLDDIIEKTRNGGAQIVKLLETGSAYYAPAFATLQMVRAILQDKHELFPCAVLLDGEYGYSDVVSGVPIILGKNGVEKVVEIKLEEDQVQMFDKSINSVKSLIQTLKDKEFFKGE